MEKRETRIRSRDEGGEIPRDSARPPARVKGDQTRRMMNARVIPCRMREHAAARVSRALRPAYLTREAEGRGNGEEEEEEETRT
jgi:hypothetical protein